MYKIVIYEDEHGFSDVEEFVRDLRDRSETSKDARINFNKVIRELEDYRRRHEV